MTAPTNIPAQAPWDGKERRRPNSCRRKGERRSFEERRADPRNEDDRPKRSLKAWLRSLTHNRLGVDRRKNRDQRVTPTRRRTSPVSLLTPEEIADLLS